MIEYLIDSEVFESNPGYRRAVIVVERAKNDCNSEKLAGLLRSTEDYLRSQLNGLNVSDHPYVAAWRSAFREFGAKPGEHRSSIEALLRRVVKPDSLPTINPLVDIGNIVSLRYLLPAGVHPMPASAATLALRRARPEDRFCPVDGGSVEALPEREIVFAQANEVLTRRWVWRQAAGTQTLPQTRAVFFNLDALAPISDEALSQAVAAVQAMVVEHASAESVRSVVLHAGNPRFVLRDVRIDR